MPSIDVSMPSAVTCRDEIVIRHRNAVLSLEISSPILVSTVKARHHPRWPIIFNRSRKLRNKICPADLCEPWHHKPRMRPNFLAELKHDRIWRAILKKTGIVGASSLHQPDLKCIVINQRCYT